MVAFYHDECKVLKLHTFLNLLNFLCKILDSGDFNSSPVTRWFDNYILDSVFRIKEVHKSRLKPNVYFSSESSKIIGICKKYKINFIKRPNYLSKDNVEKQEAVVHAFKKLKNKLKPKIIVSLQANSPEVKYKDLDFSIYLEKKYGNHLGIRYEEYKDNGASLVNSSKEVLEKSEIVLRVNCLSNDQSNLIKNQSILIGQFDDFSNKEIINKLIKKDIKIFSLNSLPRITRAQSMDVLSSQANLAGYRAVIESVEAFEKAVPMMMTAAGTITPAKVLVIGAGVAGLQAIATAKRLGGIVSATDVRIIAKEQVESLGGKFLSVEGAENLETKEGYAKEADESFKKKQTDLLKNAVKKNDIIICTALIPGKKAPRIISEDMVKSMKPGSIIYDLAVGQGGNSAFSEADKVNLVNGVKVMGAKNILNNLPLTASNLYAKNLFNFVYNLYDKKKKSIFLNEEDEIVSKTLITKEL